MSEPKPNEPLPANPGASAAGGGDPNSMAANESPASEQLSKEEQWALFEKELKESDWGHQPC